MTTGSVHRTQFEDFKRGAGLVANPPQLRVESIFLAVFHLIDACAARRNVHIDKHQKVRHELEANPAIFGDRTEEVWSAFQDIETRLRPKFVYGRSWRKEDFDAVFEKTARIEAICREVLG
ncbi:MAG: hypothetical protein A3K65_04895 [Euryarchaeota archaeon RBG_16_68_12]|nr:MAG: hypothetical protein A3K65_04895 [Euryarchaeota archaeon RBG_16_68_12]